MNSKSINDLDDNLVAYQDLFADVHMNGFMGELDDLERELKEGADGAQHVAHLKKIISWGRLSSILGSKPKWIHKANISAKPALQIANPG